MPLSASLSERIINEAYAASQYTDKDRKIIDGSIFFKNLGQVILEQFEGIRLIGEIELKEGKQTYRVLRNSLRQTLALTSLNEICNNSTTYCRAVLSLYFVWTGTFHYGEEVGHELWPSVMKGLGVEPDSNLSNSCGQLFIRCLKENGLEEFKGIVGRKYITRILLHGLIPQVHMNRFLEELIEPELQSHVGIYYTGEYLIQKWKRSGAIKYLPRPIECFIKYGEPINVHTIERFLEMAKRWEEDSPSLWRQWGLPKYMVDAFRNFIKHRHIGNLKKSWEFDKARPYLFFDLGESAVPLLHIPAQKTWPKNTFKLEWKDVQGNRHDHSMCINTMLVDGTHYTEPQDCEVGPSIDGWRLVTTNKANISNTLYSVQTPWIKNDTEDYVPLFIFNRSTGKLVNLNINKPVPEVLLLVYPQEATLEISGGRFVIEPEHLSGYWQGWKYAIIVIDEGGSFQYNGPNHRFKKNILAYIKFFYAGTEDLPQLGRAGQAPTWLRCLEDWPIYLDSGSIAITCPKNSYKSWQRAFVKLSRLDKSGFTKQLELNFKEDEQQFIAPIGFSPHWEPGVYEITLRGPLGLDDVTMPFVYLPMDKLERITGPGTDIAFEFRFRNLKNIPIEPRNPAVIRNVGETSILSLQEDSGEAFLGANIFTYTEHSVTLLFARRDIRWARRSERGLFHWDEYRCIPEEIPVQRIDEIADAKVAVQLDGASSYFNRRNKLSLLLTTLDDESLEERILSTYDAPTIRRSIGDTWIFNLKRFSDLIKSLRSVNTAAVTVKSTEDNRELRLFTVRKHLIFKDFQVKTVVGNDKMEKLKISWTPQKNDPQTHRVIRIYPVEEPSNYQNFRIEDGALPPFEIVPKPVKESGLWCLKVEAHQTRFGALSVSSESSPSFTWFRAPQNWVDWLEWPELRPDDIYRKCIGLEAIKGGSLIWINFLKCFHEEQGEGVFELIQMTLGENALIRLLPYTQGNIWEVKSVSGNRFSIKIIRSSVDKTNVRTFLINRKPCEWNRLPDNIEIDFALQNNHCYVGKVNTKWRLVKNDEKVSLTSEKYRYGQLDFEYWLRDAITPDETGRVKPLYPLVSMWDTPPELPVLKTINLTEQSFMDGAQELLNHKQDIPASYSHVNLVTLADLLDSRAREELACSFFGDQEKKAEADRLIKRWRRWAEPFNVNSLLVRIIKGRLDKEGPNGLSGAVAFIARMRCRSELWNARVIGADIERALDTLYNNTLQFVCQNKPISFLRDLILSEIIISWYWNKTYAELRQNEFIANYL